MHGPVAYTDGACLGNPGPGGWGVRILHADGTVCELGGRAAATTNNRMELQAAIAALQVLHTNPQVAILPIVATSSTDSPNGSTPGAGAAGLRRPTPP